MGRTRTVEVEVRGPITDFTDEQLLAEIARRMEARHPKPAVLHNPSINLSNGKGY